MRFGKTRMFIYINALAGILLLLYFLPWAFSSTTRGKIVTPFAPNTVYVKYSVAGKEFTGSYMRNDVNFLQQTASIRYLPFRPSVSRINSFMGMFVEPLAWWGVLLVASAMLLLSNNGVFSKGTIFELHKSFPWISMEEYFPVHIPGFSNEEPIESQEAVRKNRMRDPKGLPGKDA